MNYYWASCGDAQKSSVQCAWQTAENGRCITQVSCVHFPRDGDKVKGIIFEDFIKQICISCCISDLYLKILVWSLIIAIEDYSNLS